MSREELTKKRIEQGVCIKCGVDAIAKRSKKLCDSCLMKNKKRADSWRQDKIALAICIDCGKLPKTKSSLKCSSCSKKASKNRRSITNRRRELGLCETCGVNKTTKARCLVCQKTYNDRQVELQLQRKLLIYKHYGNKCSCCGIKEHAFLTIDHINNNGAKWRRDNHSSSLYSFVIKNNFPSDLQLLCWNCNRAKFKCGICPHER
tara:strand:- start:1159 stop:1773 length:615 start_codon:yes stop_codon:yes gene_type:complete